MEINRATSFPMMPTFAPAPPPVEVAQVATSQDLADIAGVRQGDYDYIGHGLAMMIGAGAGAAVGGVGGAAVGAYVGAGAGAIGGAAGALVGGVAGIVVGGIVGGTIAYHKSVNH